MRSAKSDILAAVAILLIAGLFHWQSAGLTGISLYFPRMLIIFLTLGGLLLLGLGIYKLKTNFVAEGGEPMVMSRILLISAAGIINVVLIPLLGFYPASALFLFAMAMALRDTSASAKKTVLLGLVFALGLCLLVWVGFTILLNVPTPTSILFES